ncbi:M48 family metallopeptidase [Spiroplasma taiwanense]|uniref:Zinc metalloprotease n=1 Tax=Spiroplasma taiwanense CT-1 TaxID=1276220 RepID=S5LYW5_9MOLU|nr:YgjP-like metallopeptidase domain-containing protein [Spiroplasma taiwanense]AGR40882.1 zinc metalloprotease [Spiroplasma taiwanense CT-1]
MQKNLKIKKKLSYKGKEIEYFLVLKNQKYIRLKIIDESIIVSAPTIANDWEIEQLIYKNISKIIKIIEYREKNRFFQISENGFIKINNQEFFASFKKEPNLNNKMEFKLYDSTEETLKKMYKKLSIIFLNYFQELVSFWKQKMDLDFKNLSVKEIKGKWGVCFPEKSKIILNIKLIHFQKDALEYVIIHELSHLIHKNHSKDFWKHVEKYLPNYKKVSDLLKVNAI